MKILKLSLAISFLGVFLVLFLSIKIQPIQVSSYQDLKLNQRIKTTGKIISIKNFDDFSVIKLNNNITIACNKCFFKETQNIEVEGMVSQYKNSLQIQAEKINLLS